MDHTAPPNAAPARLWSLDVLRGVCAGIVFLSHWHLWSNFAPQGALERFVRACGQQVYETVTLLTWPTGGQHPAVIGFFVLSGFCIHYPFERKLRAAGSAVSWSEYFRRRFLRIVPVYWAASALGLAFVAVETWRPSADPLLTLHAAATTTDVAVRLLGLAGAYPHEILAGNYTLTTVSVEMLMYVLYPAFHFLAARRSWAVLGAGFVVLQLAAVAALGHVSPYWVFNSVLMLGIFWYAGALAAHLFLAGRGRVSGFLLLAMWGVFLALKALPHFTGLNLLKQAAWGLVCVCGLLWSVRIEQRYPALGTHRIIFYLRRLGDASYSLYAMHTPAIMLASWALLQTGLRNYALQLAATMAASLAVTWVVHAGIERRFYRSQTQAAPPIAA